jgi:hypothetical protein
MMLSRRSLLLGLFAASGVGEAAQVPRPAGEFEYILPNGKTALLTQYKGKVVVLEFLFTT